MDIYVEEKKKRRRTPDRFPQEKDNTKYARYIRRNGRFAFRHPYRSWLELDLNRQDLPAFFSSVLSTTTTVASWALPVVTGAFLGPFF